ncbi:hypothetical protein I3760_01G125900 [Carya illinoinensis]|nr:hypothetical protein I3760_01G125900 [Carya illinoinensis]
MSNCTNSDHGATMGPGCTYVQRLRGKYACTNFHAIWK